MYGLEGIFGSAAGGAAAAGAEGAAGAAGAGAGAGAAGTGSMAGLGMTAGEASSLSQALALQRAGEIGNPAFASAMSQPAMGQPGAMMTGVTGPAATMDMKSPKGGGGGYGEALKSLSGDSGKTAMDLMKIAASRSQPGGGTIPSLPARQGGGTQPSVQQFLQALGRRQGGPRMGMGG